MQADYQKALAKLAFEAREIANSARGNLTNWDVCEIAPCFCLVSEGENAYVVEDELVESI